MPAAAMKPHPEIASPFIGLRPFTHRDQKLFFGRPEDGSRLGDKILGSRLVVLYSPSGSGKSSLLRAMVIPELQEMETVVMYVSRWDGRTPARLRRQLRLRLYLAGSRTATVADADLATLAEGASEELGKTIVIVLDQFEQCLVRYAAADLDALRQEFGKLVRSNARVRLVLSLREEYAARLEVFRSQLPNLFQSTFFLPRMQREGGTQAIEEPVKLAGRTWDGKLVDQLLSDLRPAAPREGGAAKVADGLELPFLQIVCRELWNEAVRRDLPEIPQTLYSEMGGKDAIINRYVERVMGALSAPAQACAAEMLRYLAPPSGVKMSYPALDLAEYCRQPQARIAEVVDHLVRETVLRATAVAGGQASYELSHDAYIGMLRPWASQFREKAIEALRIEAGRQGVRKGVLLAGIAGLVMVALVLGGWYTYGILEVYRQTTWQVQRLIRDPQTDANQILQSVVLYLQRERGSEIPLHLARALEEAASRIPAEPVMRENRAGDPRKAGSWDVTPISLQLNGRKGLDEARMIKQWAETSRAFSNWLGLPVPGVLRIREETFDTPDTAPETASQLEPAFGRTPSSRPAKPRDEGVVVGEQELKFEIPAITGELRVIDEDRVPRRLKSVFRAYEGQWKRLPGAPFGGTRRLIPQWAAPLWEGAGMQVEPEEEVIALAIAGQLMESPEILLTPGVMQELLVRQDPQTVREALAASGGPDKLRQVLIEVLRGAHHLRWLREVLEELSKRRGESKNVAAQRVLAALNDRRETMPPKFAGPPGLPPANAAGRSGIATAAEALRTATAAGGWDSAPEEIRIYLGRTLAPALLQGGAPSPRFLQDFDALRGRLYREYGIQLPRPVVLTMDSAEAVQNRLQLEDEEFAIEPRFPVPGIANAGSGSSQMRIVAVHHPEEGKASDRIIRELEQVGIAGGKWLADVPFLSAALYSKFAKADLRTLLRGMLNSPAPKRTSERASGTPRSQWILRSLLFWASGGPAAGPGEYLQRLGQTAQSLNVPSPPSGAPAASLDAIRLLTAGQEARAAIAFATLWRNSGENAAKDFLDAYPAEVRIAQQRRFVTACVNASALDPWVRYDLESWLAAPAAADQSLPRMRLCLATAYIASRRETDADALLNLVSTGLNLSLWSGDEQVRAAQELIEAGRGRPMPTRRSDLIQTLVENGMAQMADRASAITAFFGLRQHCIQENLSAWCMELMASAERRAPPAYEIAGQLASDLADGTHRMSDLDEASRLMAKARSALPYVAPPQRTVAAGFLDVTEARIQSGRCQLGSCAGLSQGRELLTNVTQTAPSAWLKRMAYLELVYNALQDGGVAPAREWIRRAQSDLRDNARMDAAEYFVALTEGNFAEVQKIAERRSPSDDTEQAQQRLYWLSLAQVLTGSKQAEATVKEFCETDHEYRDYLRLLLYWRLSTSGRGKAAEALLQQRWKEVKPDTWRERGDAAVWRERLVGYYANQVRREEITGPLDNDAAFEKSPLANLRLSRRALECEGHFYVGLYLLSQGPATRSEAAREFDAAQRSGQKLFVEYHLARSFSRIARQRTP